MSLIYRAILLLGIIAPAASTFPSDLEAFIDSVDLELLDVPEVQSVRRVFEDFISPAVIDEVVYEQLEAAQTSEALAAVLIEVGAAPAFDDLREAVHHLENAGWGPQTACK